MRNFGQWRASVLLASLLSCVAAPEAGAQSLFQSIFGNLFKSAPPKPAPAPSVSISPRRQESQFPGAYDLRPQVQQGQSFSGGAYRTVCVRSCDGFYFPISGSASRGQFSKDAESCSARCGGGKLYYLPKYSEDMAAMVDLTGRRYDQLDRAFLYRKKLIDGCTCRPMPWTAAERARHNRYAYAEEILRLNEERAKQRREEAIARANEPPLEDASEPVVSTAQSTSEAVADTPSAPSTPDSSDKIAETAPVSGPAIPNDGIAALGSATAPAFEPREGQDATAEKVSYSPRRATNTRSASKTKPRRVRKNKLKSSSSNGWSFAGGSKYTWPGDR